MRTETTTRELFTFDELSESAKDRARDWFRQSIEPDDYAETTLDDASRLFALIGLNINTRPVTLMGGGTRYDPDVYWAVDSRDSGASYHGYYSYRKGGAAQLAAEAPAEYDGKPQAQNAEINRIAQELQAIQRRHFYKLSASIDHGRHWQLSIDVECEHCHLASTDAAAEDGVQRLLQDAADWLHHQLEIEYEYQTSNEVVDESIRANDYEFTEDGDRA